MEIDNLGVSVYDYLYKGYRCAYCHDVVITNDPETLERLFKDALDKLRAEHQDKDEDFYITEKEEQALRDSINERERGECIAYEQCLHYRCLALLQQPENKEVLARLEMANRQNMQLPDENPERYTFFELNYSQVKQCINSCVYCHREINGNAPGFAYCEKSDKKRRCLYLHNACYLSLKESRYQKQLFEANARRNFSHFLSVFKPIRCAVTMAERNEAWLSFITRYELTFYERDALSTWLKYVAQEKALPSWSEAQNVAWVTNITKDLGVIILLLDAKTEEELTDMEKELVAMPLFGDRPTCQLPAPSRKALPSCLPSKDTFVCYGLAPPTLEPRQLYLNLIRTLRQARREDLCTPISV